MYIYLNTPRVCWQIPGTDIRLTRSNPIVEVTDEMLSELNDEQRSIIDLGIATHVLTKVNKSFVPTQRGGKATKILKLPVNEIQRRYVSQMILSRNMQGVQELLELERKSSKPRSSVIEVLENAKAQLLQDHPEEKYYADIEEAVEKIEGVIVEESAPVAKPKKPPARRKRRTTRSQTKRPAAAKSRGDKTGVIEK